MTHLKRKYSRFVGELDKTKMKFDERYSIDEKIFFTAYYVGDI